MKYDIRQPDFEQGKATDAYRFMGCQWDETAASAVFRVWAPNAPKVTVIGDFNGWDCNAAPMTRISNAGVWECTVTGVHKFDNYKFYLKTDWCELYKSDPYAFHSETHDSTASKVYPLDAYDWKDKTYMAARAKADPYRAPINIYEAHIGSWKRYPDGNTYSYRAFADAICPYLTEMGYTHLELMGIAEYPFDGSWGYQVTGYYAPTSRYGTPDDFKYLVDKLHGAGIGVILDWVPGHFPKNGNGLYEFDGGPLYEPSDELKKEHKEWGTRCFDYRRGEVESFLISNAAMWLDVYHIDGLRVDAVASMLYLDYGRQEWRPNEYGGKENLDAVKFFRDLNTAMFRNFPGIMMIAEESTAWPNVTKPVDMGGLGFNFKWNMGWMNDTLRYAKTDPLFRSGIHNNLTFSMTYAFSENYVLPISHDEVVHGKGSLLNKMPGSYEEKFAGFRGYLMNMFGHPGKKLLFMGGEFGQFAEWDFSKQLDWQLLDFDAHRSTKDFVKTLNATYKENACLYQIEDSWDGYRWHVADDYKQNIIVYERRDRNGKGILAVINFSPVRRAAYRFGADPGTYREILYSDTSGWNTGRGSHKAEKVASHGFTHSLVLDVEPYAAVYMTLPAPTKPKATAETKQAKPTKTASATKTARSAAKPKQTSKKSIGKEGN